MYSNDPILVVDAASLIEKIYSSDVSWPKLTVIPSVFWMYRKHLYGSLISAFAYIADEVIRKRLLIDGDGAGDDRRINVLLKSFTKWCNSPGTPDEGSVKGSLQTTCLHFVPKNLIQVLFVTVFRFTQYQRMMGILAQCEFSMGKTLMVYDMNLREMENYEKIYTNIGRQYDFFFLTPCLIKCL